MVIMSISSHSKEEECINNGTSIKLQRPSDTTTGRLNLSTFKVMVVARTLVSRTPILDGGNCSDSNNHSLEMRRDWLWVSTDMIVQE